MSKRKPPLTQAEKQLVAQARQLKKKGLAYQNVDLRGKRPTRHMRETVKKFAGALKGTAQVVTVPTKAARRLDKSVPRSRNKVLVPIAEKGQRAFYNKKTGQLETSVKYPGGRKIVFKGPHKPKVIREWEGKPNHKLQVLVNRGRFNEMYLKDTLDELEAIFGEKGSFRNFSKWIKTVDLVEWVPESGTKSSIISTEGAKVTKTGRVKRAL